METNVEKIELFPDAGGGYRWRAIAGNGEIVATSESYDSHSNAQRAAMATFPDVEIHEGMNERKGDE